MRLVACALSLAVASIIPADAASTQRHGATRQSPARSIAAGPGRTVMPRNVAAPRPGGYQIPPATGANYARFPQGPYAWRDRGTPLIAGSYREGTYGYPYPYYNGYAYGAVVPAPAVETPGPRVIVLNAPAPAVEPGYAGSNPCGPALITVPSAPNFRPFTACPARAPNVVVANPHPGPRIIQIE